MLDNFSKSVSMAMVGVGFIGTGLLNTITTSNVRNEFYKDNCRYDEYKYSTNSSSTLFNLNLFDIIKTKYNINIKEEFTIKQIIKSLDMIPIEMDLLKLNRVICKYNINNGNDIPKLTFIKDGTENLLLVTITTGENIEKSLDSFNLIKKEWFAESSIQINKVLFLDIVV